VRIEVIVNGAPRQVAADATVAALIGELGLDPGRVAVEKNREVVPRAAHTTTPLQPGDRLELVSFVGGG
jgi:thiamine biosynthesis protein ThiS